MEDPMNVKQLIEALQKFDGELLVGSADDFGNIETIDSVDLDGYKGFVRLWITRGDYITEED